MAVAAALLLGYLLGSVPWGLLLTRAAGHGDIRAIGSGNIGATNVLRTGRRDIAAATLLLDAGKGAAAVLLAAWWSGGPYAGLWAGVFAVVGHCTSIWMRGRGGKGVATGLGVIAAVAWPVGDAHSLSVPATYAGVPVAVEPAPVRPVVKAGPEASC